MSFFENVADFFTSIWSIITHTLQSIVNFFEILLGALDSIDLFTSPEIPSIIGSCGMFVIAIALVKILISLGGYSE
ncbi:MAG: hypothetical protein E7365_00685 [Clostridiales bacterium]|nr:hypothetical protein [Clostridiales bacterium]